MPTRSPWVVHSRGGVPSMSENESNVGAAMSENESSIGERRYPQFSSGELRELSRSVAGQAERFQTAVRQIACSGDVGRAVPLLLLEVSQMLLAGARLGAQVDFVPADTYEPDVGREADFDQVRVELANMLAGFDDYTVVFDPYLQPAELIGARISDDVTAIASSLEHGLQHRRAGRYAEALWWWQFSYVSSWGGEASDVLRALQWIISHDRLDADPAPQPA